MKNHFTSPSFSVVHHISPNPKLIFFNYSVSFFSRDSRTCISYPLKKIYAKVIKGCRTRYCCSGHPGRFGEGYIVFEEIPETLTEQIGKLTYWKHDASWEKGTSPDADHPPLIRWEMNGIACTCATTWLKALLELAEMECLPQRNSFDEYRIESTYKGRSPHKQEIRHIYPVTTKKRN